MKLTPLPIASATPPDRTTGSEVPIQSQTFVDEEAIAEILSQPTFRRTIASPDDLVLSAGGNDFAGWMKPVTPTTHRPPSPSQVKCPTVVHQVQSRPIPTHPRPEPRRVPPPTLLKPWANQKVDETPSSPAWWIAAAAIAVVSIAGGLIFFSIRSRAESGTRSTDVWWKSSVTATSETAFRSAVAPNHR